VWACTQRVATKIGKRMVSRMGRARQMFLFNPLYPDSSGDCSGSEQWWTVESEASKRVSVFSVPDI
jgi:hypothetical protein